MVNKNEQIEYSGRDNLKVMKNAKNYNKFLLKTILSHAEKGDLLVDFGAGNGNFSDPISSKGYKVICVETDSVLSNELSKQGMKILADLEQVEDGSIDYIYSANVLEHIEDDQSIIDLWFRKLSPSGKLFVYVPAFNILFSAMDHKVGHKRRYIKADLCKKIRRPGFQVQQAHYADSIGFLATIIYKLLDRNLGDINHKMLVLYDRFIFPFSRLMDMVTHEIGGKNIFVYAIKKDRDL